MASIMDVMGAGGGEREEEEEVEEEEEEGRGKEEEVERGGVDLEVNEGEAARY